MQPLAPLHLNSHCMAALFVADVPFFALADGTLLQRRLTMLSPRQADVQELSAMFEDAMVAW